jgi:hypothetical protein
MVATMRPFASCGAEYWLCSAPVMVAPLIHDVDHFVGFMRVTMRWSFPQDAKGCDFVALIVFTPFIHDVNHFGELVFATMRRSFPQDAEGCEFVALVVVAPFTHDVYHCRELVHCATCRRLPLPAITRLFLLRTTFDAICHIVQK